MKETWELIAAYYDSNRWICATYESHSGEWDTTWYPPESPIPEAVVIMADEDERIMSGA